MNQQSSNNDLARRQRRYRPLRPDPEIFNLDDINIAIDHQRVNPRPPRLDIESIDIDERTTLNPNNNPQQGGVPWLRPGTIYTLSIIDLIVKA